MLGKRLETLPGCVRDWRSGSRRTGRGLRSGRRLPEPGTWPTRGSGREGSCELRVRRLRPGRRERREIPLHASRPVQADRRSRYFDNKSVKKSLLGLNYTYDYNVRFANGAYERRFFSYLVERGKARAANGFPETVQRQTAHVLQTTERGAQALPKAGGSATSRRTTA